MYVCMYVYTFPLKTSMEQVSLAHQPFDVEFNAQLSIDSLTC